ncbi:hypothetical protein HYT57_04720 [Candidatus Woesearchaeota archaeon]|nr:hypothetical protein [Candidatus Woesearchaeota archaeon]
MIANFLSKIKNEAFRLELLPCYDIEKERESFKKFEKGVEVQSDKELLQFCKIISNFAGQGKKIIKVHVIPKRLTNYLRFEIETGYLPQSKAGAEIYLIYSDMYKNLLAENFNPIDFWIFDNKAVIELIYNKEGKFLRERMIKDKGLLELYINLKNNLVKNAIPLNEWLNKNLP